MLSAAINDYEPLTLYNFHKTGNKLAKISGGLAYMKKLDSSHDDELLLIVDGFDEWFQLPASIMEARYHKINRRENERLLTRTGHPYKQSIIVSTQRQCWPGNSADISCYAAPESPLPAYVFGPETDNMVDDWNKYARLRPRYMNAGYIMGPVKAMRKLWMRAQEYADQNPNVVGLDQNILARIWGEQNYVREYTRFHNEPLGTESPDHSSSPPSQRHLGENQNPQKRSLGYPDDKPNPVRKIFHPQNDTNYEFGIGLDYGSELSLPTVFAEYDADWLSFSNETSLSKAFKAQNVTHPGATRLQQDIAALPVAPFASLVRKPQLSADEEEPQTKKDLREFAKNATWNDVGLFTNLWTGITPAIVHHNAWRDGLKDRRRTTWEKMWFQPYARDLLDAWVARQQAQSGGGERSKGKFGERQHDSEVLVETKGPSTARGLGAKTDNDEEGNWASWRDLCGDEQQKEVFRDKKGPWRGLGGEGEEKKKKKKEGEGLHIVHNEPAR